MTNVFADLLRYLRQAVIQSFSEDDEFKYMFVSSPTSLKLELHVIDYALQLLQCFNSQHLNRSSVEQDLNALTMA